MSVSLARFKAGLALALSALLSAPGLPPRAFAQEEAATEALIETAANPICNCASLELAAADDEAAAAVSADASFDAGAEDGAKLRIHNDMLAGVKHGDWAWTDPFPSTIHDPGYRERVAKPGAKADTQIGYDPDAVNIRGKKGGKYYDAKWARPPNASADVWLFHEMVHADDFMNGNFDATKIKNKPPHGLERHAAGELRAVGLIGAHAYSENVYRSERFRADGKPFLKREFY